MMNLYIQGDSGAEDCEHALWTLFNVLFSMSKVMVSKISSLHSQYSQQSTQQCSSIGHLKLLIFTFVPNEELMVFRCRNI